MEVEKESINMQDVAMNWARSSPAGPFIWPK